MPFTRRKMSVKQLRTRIRRLKAKRKNSKTKNKRRPQSKNTVWKRTNGHCHICGGKLKRGDWVADHVVSHVHGGGSSPENYLPAHPQCNSARWHFLADERQLIIQLGLWAKNEVIKSSELGEEMAERFSKWYNKRLPRRKGKSQKPE